MTLTPVATQLYECEHVIESSLGDAAFAIRKIRDDKLYQERWSTFEAYCKDRWDMARRTAYQMIDHADTLDAITASEECAQIAHTDDEVAELPMPVSEGQTRPLAALEPEERGEAWREAVAEAHDQGKAVPTGKIVKEVVERIKRGGKGKKKAERRQQSSDHPATFSKRHLDAIADLLVGQEITRILDPFAGEGNVHVIADRLGVDSIGVEIEPEWANQRERNIVGDSTTLTRAQVGRFDCVVTSPAYGNRMADKHNAKDDSDRATYRHRLGRELTENNGGGLQWGDEYRALHLAVWRRVVKLLDEGGLFVLNVKDHVRDSQRVPVSGWHVATLLDLGLRYVDDNGFESKGLGSAGSNEETRVGVEHVYLFRKN